MRLLSSNLLTCWSTFSGVDEHCETRKTSGTTLPPYWGWVQDARYAGQRKIHGETLDVWEYRVCHLFYKCRELYITLHTI